jgi:hypothetical protein
MSTPPVVKPVPLSLYARRLGRFVAAGLIAHSEALDALMASALNRGTIDTWDRAEAAERWLSGVLTREAERRRAA